MYGGGKSLKRVPGDVQGGTEEDLGRWPWRDTGRSVVLWRKSWGCSVFLGGRWGERGCLVGLGCGERG